LTVTTAYVGLGSNLGNRLASLRKAADFLSRDPGTKTAKFSSCYETEPVDFKAQPRFLNAVARLETTLPAPRLLELLQAVERKLKRRRHRRSGPRTLDLDLLLYGKEERRGKTLVLPHPRMARRAFVLVPLKEVTRKIWYKGRWSSVRALLERGNVLKKQSVVLFKRKWR
jgi:2-amino-4-hydroxy-6-hydroxymethyldihydropteridine diphosphokinase